MVEFSVTLPVLILLAVGLLDFGSFLIHYLYLTRAVHEGVMVAAREPGLQLGGQSASAVDRVRETLKAYTAAGKVWSFDYNTSTISQAYEPGPTPTQFGTVSVSVTTAYQALLGMALQFQIEAHGPYLRYHT